MTRCRPLSKVHSEHGAHKSPWANELINSAGPVITMEPTHQVLRVLYQDADRKVRKSIEICG